MSTEELNKKPEETTSVRIDSIDQLAIEGRTKEETELIHKILSEDKKEFEEFLTTDWDFSHEQEAIEILTYDFTGDGKDEIIVSKFYLNISAFLTYNYVYDCDGRKMMELDRRYGGDEGKEEYYIFKDFTKEEEEKLWYGASGVDELTKTKKCLKEGEEPEAYRKLLKEKKMDGFSINNVILYSEEDGFLEYKEDRSN